MSNRTDEPIVGAEPIPNWIAAILEQPQLEEIKNKNSLLKQNFIFMCK